MKILVTGANGFVGKNLISTLENIRDLKDRTRDVPSDLEIFTCDIGTSEADFERYCKECDFVFNLVGVHRPKDDSEFMKGNFGFLSKLLDTLEKYGNTPRIAFSSSIQAKLDNPYGESKRAAENALFEYSEKTGAKVYVFRFSNLFGKWSRPNYNSVVATFCYNIANDLPIEIRDRNHEMELIYIDDVINELLEVLMDRGHKQGDFYTVSVSHFVTLGKLADLIYSFKNSRGSLMVPNMTDGSFSKKLYSTYLSYLPTDKFAYPLNMHKDERGSFTEIVKTTDRGQVSVNISKPGITKGQHWHHTKNEKFLVVSGKGVVRFRKIGEKKVYEYFVSGEKLEVVDIPTGYTHNIENLGDTDMVTIMWCNECFNPSKPDTYFLPVEEIKNVDSTKKEVLVLGGAGMAGYVIAAYFKEHGYNVTIFDKTTVDGFNCVVGSAKDTELLKKILLAKPYAAVLNCIGLLNRACDEYRCDAAYLNGYLPHLLAETFENSKTKVIHISSDCVFSGNKNEAYNESEQPDAADNYGKTKAVGEIDNNKDLTFRTSIIGPDRLPQKNGLLNWFVQQDEVTGFTKTIWSGVSTITLARAMLKAVECDISGIYHLVNNEYISKYELLKLFNKHFGNGKVKINCGEGIESKKVLVNTRKDFDFVVPRYENMVEECAEWVRAHREAYPDYYEV